MTHHSPPLSGKRPRHARGFVAIALLMVSASSAAAQDAPDSAGVIPVPVPGSGWVDSTAAAGSDSTILAPTPEFAHPAAGADSTAPTAAATPNARLNVIRKVRLESSSHNVVRSGPGNGFALVGVYMKGATFPVIAKSGDWYNVRLSESDTGWIHSSLVKEFDDLSDLEFKPNPRLYTRTGAIVLGGYAGAYAFDRKSNSLVAGGRVSYYVFDRFQFEGGVAWTHIRRPAEIVESLFGLSLEAEDFHMLFYQMNATWELLPGRQMVPFLSAGIGSAIMQGESEPSFNFGAGTVLFLSKRHAMRWEVRDYRLHSGSEAARVSNDNVEFTLGTQYIF